MKKYPNVKFNTSKLNFNVAGTMKNISLVAARILTVAIFENRIRLLNTCATKGEIETRKTAKQMVIRIVLLCFSANFLS